MIQSSRVPSNPTVASRTTPDTNFDVSSGAGFADNFFKVNLFRKGFMQYDGFDEPTYLTFVLDFDFSGLMTDDMTSLPASPLFSEATINPAEIKTSAIQYLNSKYTSGIGSYLSSFKSTLKYITNSAPWYFQSISGLDKIWSNIFDGMKDGMSGGTELTISCLEAIDLRLLHLAEFYQKAAYDAKFMRHRLPDNLKNFSMSIYVAEVRDIYSINGGAPSQTTDPIVGVARNITGRPDLSAQSAPEDEYRLNSLFYMKFDCYQCEFDFSPVFGGSKIDSFVNESPFGTSFKIKIGRVETAGGFGKSQYSSNLYKDRNATKSEMDATAKALTDGIGATQRASLSREKLTLEKLARSLGPLSNVATSALLGVERKVNDISRIPNKIINSALSEVQQSVEKGSLGNIYD